VIATTIRDKIWSDDDALMLEDESGRIKLVGPALAKFRVVTGVIMAALGCENADGEFEVADLCFTDPAPRMSEQTDDMDIDGGCLYCSIIADDILNMLSDDGNLVAFISGLDFGPDTTMDMSLELLKEYLTSELGTPEDASWGGRISRVVIVGNSIAPPVDEDEDSEEEEELKAEETGEVSSLI